MTHLQTFLRERGTIQQLHTQYSIKSVRSVEHPNLVLFKYSQIDSPMHLPIVQESRGVILDEDDNWRVVARGFDKFFNYGEAHTADIDWTTAEVQEKVDGSLCCLHEYKGAWRVSTTGSPDASGSVNGESFTFSDLFFRTLADHMGSLRLALPRQCHDNCYLFELTSPYNRIVVKHDKPSLTLLAIRHRVSGRYYDPHNSTLVDFVPVVKSFPIGSFTDIVASFEHIDPLSQEGYVVVDGAGNRVKVKHPGYVALHQLKDTATPKALLDVARKGEASEVASYFPDLASELERYRGICERCCAVVDSAYEMLANIETQKEFAGLAVRYPYSGVLFNLRSGKSRSTADFLATATLPAVIRLLTSMGLLDSASVETEKDTDGND